MPRRSFVILGSLDGMLKVKWSESPFATAQKKEWFLLSAGGKQGERA